MPTRYPKLPSPPPFKVSILVFMMHIQSHSLVISVWPRNFDVQQSADIVKFS